MPVTWKAEKPKVTLALSKFKASLGYLQPCLKKQTVSEKCPLWKTCNIDTETQTPWLGLQWHFTFVAGFFLWATNEFPNKKHGDLLAIINAHSALV